MAQPTRQVVANYINLLNGRFLIALQNRPINQQLLGLHQIAIKQTRNCFSDMEAVCPNPTPTQLLLCTYSHWLAAEADSLRLLGC
jgi:hypothetical protein